LKRVLGPLTLDKTRAWIKRVILGDVGDLNITQIKVVLVLLQGGERFGALVGTSARRAMGGPQGGDPGPKLVGRPAPGHTPENRHARPQFREIKAWRAHNPHTSGTYRMPAARALTRIGCAEILAMFRRPLPALRTT